MSRFLDSISTIITVFHKHAKEDGDCSNLSRRRMKEFIQREFADVIAKPHDPQTIDKILHFLEWDEDGEIDFNEFLLLVFRVAKACYWYLPKGPCLLQRTKLTTSGKSLQEPEIKNRGSHWQLQEEEQQTCERNHNPPCEPELQQDTRVNKLETPEERGSHHQQRNKQSRNDAKRSNDLGEPMPQGYEERSQEPTNQWNSQRSHRPREPAGRGDVQLSKHSNVRAHEPVVQAEDRQNREGPQPEQLADVRSRSQTCEPQPLPNRWSRHQPREPAIPGYDQKNQRPQEADRCRHNQPHKPELLIVDRSHYHLRELEQKALQHSSHQAHEPVRLESRQPHQSYIQEPLELDLRYYEIHEQEKEIYEQGKNQEHELEYPETEKDIHQPRKWEERHEARRKEPARERRISLQGELEVEVDERRSRQTREREERGATTNQRDTRERCHCQPGEPEHDGRRERESVRYERSRETDVVAEEAEVTVQRVSRDAETREDVERRDRQREREESEGEWRMRRGREREEPTRERRIDLQGELEVEVDERRSRQTREREERGATTNQRDTRERPDCRPGEPNNDGMRERESVRYERSRETDVVAEEAKVKVQRVSRDPEPREDKERRDRQCEREESESERKIRRGREREEPTRERRIDLQGELEVEVDERRSRQTREREERGATTNQRDTRERPDCRPREPNDDGRRERESMRYERSRETDVVAEEAEVTVQRVSRDPEPRGDVERRDRQGEREESEGERKIRRAREREEPTRERRIDLQGELEVEVDERHSRQTRKREERGAMRSHRETYVGNSLPVPEEEQESDILQNHQAKELQCEPSVGICCEPSESQEWSNHRHEEEARKPNRSQTHEDEGRTHKKSLYQTVEVDNRDLCPPGEQASVTDMRVSYIPAEPDVRPEVQVLPQSFEPQTIAYLVHVIQNLNNPEATIYKIICHHPDHPGQPIYVKKCYMSPQPLAVPCDRSNHPEPPPQRDEQETGEPELPRQGGAAASSSQENTGDLNGPQERSEMGVKEGAHQASASETDGVKGDPCQAKPKEDRRDSQHPKLPDTEEKEHQPQGDGSKASREQVPQEPKSSCQGREREDREAKSCLPLLQAPEPREAWETGQRATEESRPQPRDEVSCCHEDVELPPLEKSHQPWQEENSKRKPQQASNAQPQQEEEPCLCTKQTQGPPGPSVSQEAPSHPPADEAKAS
ncbi:trichohyalin [Egretta garzetta]|uniref:trichohyalin n=1 Tax=Egretta garzetta TaxID=188379 RepID=UPI00163D1D05|nr:trichohyalin [Egretta garzetta]